jgi:ubiquinone/menaquinone biosynthesis C-methylase UbiE
VRPTFDDRSFEAGWTMSTLLHIADEDLDAALAEVVRVLRPESPLAIGLWGDQTATWQGNDSMHYQWAVLRTPA